MILLVQNCLKSPFQIILSYNVISLTRHCISLFFSSLQRNFINNYMSSDWFYEVLVLFGYLTAFQNIYNTTGGLLDTHLWAYPWGNPAANGNGVAGGCSLARLRAQIRTQSPGADRMAPSNPARYWEYCKGNSSMSACDAMIALPAM